MSVRGGLARHLRRLLAYAGVPPTIVAGAVRLAWALPRLRRAEVVVVMDEGGFGHTITGPDALRRVARGRRAAFVALSEYGRHNRRVASIWPDVDVVFLPLSLGVHVRGRSVALQCLEWYKRLAPRAVIALCRTVVPGTARVLSLMEFYERLPLPADLRPTIEGRFSGVHWWPIAYTRLVREAPASRVRLPERSRAGVRQRLARIRPWNISGRRLCCLYLRQKGQGSGDVTNRRRAGSSLAEYIAAIRVLAEAGYQVLTTGDVALAPSVFQSFGGMLVDAASAEVDKDVFSLFAATEADIFVGEVGGGTWLPGINGIPRLVVNAFPYFYGFPNSWMYYKILTNRAGRSVDPRDLFAAHAYDWEARGMKVHDNSSQEIAEAVACFLQDLEHPRAVSEHSLEFPANTWIRHAEARLSPVWLRRVRGQMVGPR